jgi:hypothetical protein
MITSWKREERNEECQQVRKERRGRGDDSKLEERRGRGDDSKLEDRGEKEKVIASYEREEMNSR